MVSSEAKNSVSPRRWSDNDDDEVDVDAMMLPEDKPRIKRRAVAGNNRLKVLLLLVLLLLLLLLFLDELTAIGAGEKEFIVMVYL